LEEIARFVEAVASVIPVPGFLIITSIPGRSLSVDVSM